MYYPRQLPTLFDAKSTKVISLQSYTVPRRSQKNCQKHLIFFLQFLYSLSHITLQPHCSKYFRGGGRHIASTVTPLPAEALTYTYWRIPTLDRCCISYIPLKIVDGVKAGDWGYAILYNEPVLRLTNPSPLQNSRNHVAIHTHDAANK